MIIATEARSFKSYCKCSCYEFGILSKKTLVSHCAENKLLPTQLGKGGFSTYFLYSSTSFQNCTINAIKI